MTDITREGTTVSQVKQIELPSRVKIMVPGCESKKPNGAPIQFETEFYSGSVALQTKTPDTAGYFKHSKKSFRLRIRGHFQQKPRGPVWWGLECTEPLVPGSLRAAIWRVVTMTVKAVAKTEVYINLRHTSTTRPCIAMKQSAGYVPAATTHILSFAHPYIDFEAWKLTNLPAVRCTKIEYLIGKQPIRMVMYSAVNGHALDQRQELGYFEIMPST